MDAKHLEACIQVHVKQMVTPPVGPRQRTAATQVAMHTAEWLRIHDKRHPAWSEILDLLCIALKLMSDDEGGDASSLGNPDWPASPYGKIPLEWAETLQRHLQAVLVIVGEELLVRLRANKPSRENFAFLKVG